MKKICLLIATVALLASCSGSRNYQQHTYDNGNLELGLPKDFAEQKEITTTDSTKHVLLTRYISTIDSSNHIEVATKLDTDGQPLEFYKTAYDQEVGFDNSIKVKDSQIKDINGHKCLVVTQSKTFGQVMIKYTRVIVTITKGHLQIINICFEGKYKDEYADIADAITKSVKAKN